MIKIVETDGAKFATIDLNISSKVSKYDKTTWRKKLTDREKTILSYDQIKEKINNKEIHCISKSDAENKVFLYHDKTDICPESSIHLYTETGNLIITLPWQGDDCQDFSKSPYITSDITRTTFEKLMVSATESGMIVVNFLELNRMFNNESEQVEIFDYSGRRKTEILFGLCDFKTYSNKSIINLATGNLTVPFVVAASIEGDKILNFRKTHRLIH